MGAYSGMLGAPNRPQSEYPGIRNAAGRRPGVAVEYRIEISRRVQRIAGQELDAVPAGRDEDEGYLQVQYRPYGIPADEHERFTRFASAVSPLLDSLATQARTERSSHAGRIVAWRCAPGHDGEFSPSAGP